MKSQGSTSEVSSKNLKEIHPLVLLELLQGGKLSSPAVSKVTQKILTTYCDRIKEFVQAGDLNSKKYLERFLGLDSGNAEKIVKVDKALPNFSLFIVAVS